MLPHTPKLLSLESMVAERHRLRQLGKKLVMTNGCFDLLHTGHIYFLQNARQLGDHLIVAVNSDASVQILKGPKRPVQSELERAFGLAALGCIDSLVMFTKPNLIEEITALQPNIYTKAGDYDINRLHAGERAALEACQAQIRFLPFLTGFSTTGLIQKIIRAGGID